LVFNLFRQNAPLVSILNSAVFLLAFLVFHLNFSDRHRLVLDKRPSHLITILLIATVPLLSVNPGSILISLIPIAFLIYLLFSESLGFLNLIFKGLFMLLFIIGNLFLIGIAEFPGGFPKLEFNYHIFVEEIRPYLGNNINLLRGELQLSPVLEALIYNKLIFYPYYYLSNLAQFLEPLHFYQPIFLVNLYLLILGIYEFFQSRLKNRLFFLSLAAITFLIIGFHTLPDPIKVFYLLTPLIIVFILLGLRRVNLKLYMFLLVISLALLFLPSI
jgi:hypothetical protein